MPKITLRHTLRLVGVTFAQRRLLIEFLIDRIIITNDEVEIATSSRPNPMVHTRRSFAYKLSMENLHASGLRLERTVDILCGKSQQGWRYTDKLEGYWAYNVTDLTAVVFKLQL